MKEFTREARLILIALYFLAGLTFSLTVARYLNSPLRFDEVDQSLQAKGILKHGVPKVFYSEQRALYTQPFFGYDALYGMWHPPLYLYSLAMSALLFGIGNIPMRAVSLIWFILSLWLVWRLTQVLSEKPTPMVTRGIPLALALLTPLLAEGSLYLDIDNTSLAFSLLLFVYFFLKSPEENSWKRILLLSFIFTFTLWSKLTTPFIVLASVVMYHCLNRNFKKGIIQGLLIGGFGVGLFLLTYWVYCSLFNYPARFMFDFTIRGKSNMYLSPHPLKQVLHSLRWNFVWTSPAVAIMLGILIVLRVLNYMRHRRLDKIDFLIIFSAAGMGVYTLWGAMWGKYTFPLVLAGVIAIGVQISNSLSSARITHPAAFVTLILLLAVVHLFAVPALQVRPYSFDIRSAGLWQAISDIRNLYLLITITAFIVFFILARHFVMFEKRETLLFVILLTYLLVANPINSMKIIFSPYDRSPYHPLQEQGFVKTIQFINDTLGRDDVIFAPKDIGFYFHGMHYPTDCGLSFDELIKLQKLTLLPEIYYIVDSVIYPNIPDRNFLLKTSSVVLLKRIGTFVIYQISTAEFRNTEK